MRERQSKDAGKVSKQAASLFAAPVEVDSTLASLFASSSGPVKVPKPKPRSLVENKSELGLERLKSKDDAEDPVEDSPIETSSVSDELDTQTEVERPRKRRRVETDDLEGAYFQKLAREEEREEQLRGLNELESTKDGSIEFSNDIDDSLSDTDTQPMPVHETLRGASNDIERAKLQRTVFLSNVSITAIRSKSARKQLLNHLETPLKSSENEVELARVESIRFRSTAYASGGVPKKAAFATKDLMEQTTKSTNAYVVFPSHAAAEKVTKKLNGSMILDRHLRIDHLASPSTIDHKRCVFVGNLNFVDEETPKDPGDDDIVPRRARARLPADAEEGLWRVFSKVGNVQNVRVVRDKHTRVGKGFAYVQFTNQNGVEAALLLNDKKFPPMLPRKLRVMRAKKVREKSAQPPAVKRSVYGSRESAPTRTNLRVSAGERPKAEGRSGSANSGKLVFEGYRASKPSVKDKKEKKRPSGKITGRSAKRGAAFKALGGQKKRDRKS